MKRLIPAAVFIVCCVFTACVVNIPSQPEKYIETPSGLHMTDRTSSSISVAWNSVNESAGYRIYYMEMSDTSSASLTVTGATECTVNGLSANSRYFFGVSTIAAEGESKLSPIIKVQTTATSESGKFREVTNGAPCTLSGLTGNAVYLIKYNPGDDLISQGDTGWLEPAAPSSQNIVQLDGQECIVRQLEGSEGYGHRMVTGVYPGGIVRYEDPAVLEFNSDPPPVGHRIADGPLCSDAAGTVQTYAVGDKKQFWVQNKDSSWVQIPAVLRATGTYCLVWVADENYNDGSVSSTDETITGDQAKKTAVKFDLLYPGETAVFGAKYGAGDRTENLVAPSDKIAILVYDIDGDYLSEQTSGTAGFFWAKDMYTDAFIQKDQPGTCHSNETELFYLDAHFLDIAPNMMYSTLAHEFQHMLNFVHKTVRQGLISSTWYNEMLSMLCEDMMQDTLGITDEESPKSRLPTANYFYNYGSTTWPSVNDVLVSYANAYAWGAFLARNYGGAKFVQSMALNNKVDKESVAAAVAASGSADTYENAFLKYGQALVYTDAESAQTMPSLNKKAAAFVGGYEFTFYPIDLCSYYETDGNTTYVGPVVTSAGQTGTKTLGPWGLSVHKAGTYSGTVTFTFKKQTDPKSKERVFLLVK